MENLETEANKVHQELPVDLEGRVGMGPRGHMAYQADQDPREIPDILEHRECLE